MAGPTGFFTGVAATVASFAGWGWTRRRKTAQDNTANLLEQAVRGAPTGVIIVDAAGEVVLSNDQARALGIVTGDGVHPDVWEHTHRVLAGQGTDSGGCTVDIHLEHAPTRSRIHAVQATIKPLAVNQQRYAIVYCVDESENVRMESARRDFVANVSHELKTPVGAMALLAEALLESKDDPQTVEHFGSKLTAEAHRMANLINELIALSKLQGAEALPNMGPVSVDEVIDEAVVRTQLSADTANITVERGPVSGVVVAGDATLLVTAVSNLINNAINYSPAGALVSISQNILDDEDTVQIQVTDQGIGIALADQQRVFERFFRVDKARSRATGGTGLGLAIVKHVAANHGGAITLWSQLGEGSTFTLELPVAGDGTPTEGHTWQQS